MYKQALFTFLAYELILIMCFEIFNLNLFRFWNGHAVNCVVKIDLRGMYYIICSYARGWYTVLRFFSMFFRDFFLVLASPMSFYKQWRYDRWNLWVYRPRTNNYVVCSFFWKILARMRTRNMRLLSLHFRRWIAIRCFEVLLLLAFSMSHLIWSICALENCGRIVN